MFFAIIGEGIELMDEGGWYIRSGQPSIDRCSSLGSHKSGDKPAIVAQNLDWVNSIEGLGVIFRIKDPASGIEALVPSIAGVIGTCGLNQHAIGICTNALWRILNNSTDGLPVNFVVRAVLEMQNLDQMITFLHDIQHASGENYLIGDAERALTFECSANKVAQYIPYEGACNVYHTNHPLVNDDLQFPITEIQRVGTSESRFDYLAFRLKKSAQPLTLDMAKSILSSHHGPVCAHHNFKPNSGFTANSVIYVLSENPELYISNGPPCISGYEHFIF
ncbi:MAG: C45 family peptidase [Anaerolineaceae bacterium]|nr:C45 family peptidase [Anaerolineaceae bacterium]